MKKKRVLLFSGLVVWSWLLCMPEKARGQGSTWVGSGLQQMVNAAMWRIGFLRVNAAFALNNAGFDSDIYYGYFENPVPDFIVSVGTPVQVLLPLSKKIVLDIFDSPQYMHYGLTASERALNNIFRGQVHFALDRIYIQAGGGLSNVRLLSRELEINIRQKQDSINSVFLWQVSRKTSLALLYGGARYDYGDAEFGGTSLAETLNRTENWFDFVAYLQPNPKVRFFVNGQYGTYAFPASTSSLRDARSLGVFGGLEIIPSAGEEPQTSRIQGSIRLGYLHLDIRDQQFVDGSGFAGAVNVSAKLSRRTTGRVHFIKDFPFSIFSGSAYYISTTYGGGITHLLSRRDSLAYDLSFHRSSYPEDAGGGIPDAVSSRYATHTLILDVRLARNLGITFLGSFGRRVLDEAGLGRNRNFFGFSLVYGSPPSGISAPVGALGGMSR